ncbi:MAG TPA: hypothetical protein VGE04_11510 [Chloroflexia bacterium]
MRAEESEAVILIEGNGYTLSLSRHQPTAELELNGRGIATLNMASALDAMDGHDEQSVMGAPDLTREAEGVTVTWRGSSDRWEQKVVELQAWEDGFSYGYSVVGEGEIDRAHLLRTRLTPAPAYDVRVFNPEPNSGRVRYTGQRCDDGCDCYVCHPGQLGNSSELVPPDFMTITVGRDKTYHGANWFLTPSPFCYAVEGAGNWLAMGVTAAPGAWNFSDMHYPGGGFGFSLVYDGHETVRGSWQSPRLVCLSATDEYDAIERYCDWLREQGLTPSHGRGPVQEWWQQPIFCGWGEQVSQEVHLGEPKAQAGCRQASYERWLGTLDAHGIDPGTVVIDDKWQLSWGMNDVDTVKWPDMQGFIAAQHERGRHVLLWLKAWEPEGVPPGECILSSEGVPVSVDPGNPRFAERLAGQVRFMLRDLDADGFKIDFTHLIPRGAGMRSLGGKWGLELMRQWLSIVSEAAREAKPDALVMAHTANPYLADLVDMLRLNDIAGLPDIYASIVPDMRHRARIARIASPYWLLDSDNWPCSSRPQWREYVVAQATGEFGVPSLYHAERLGWGTTDEPLEEEDYAAIRRAWEEYRRTIDDRR